jgi:hypothetical protein
MAQVPVVTSDQADTANYLFKMLEDFADDFKPYSPVEVAGVPAQQIPSVTNFTQCKNNNPVYFKKGMGLERAKTAWRALDADFATKVRNDASGRWQAVKENIKKQEAANDNFWIAKLDRDLLIIGKQIKLLWDKVKEDPLHKVPQDQVVPPAHL